MANVHIFGNSLAAGFYGDWSSKLKEDAGERRLRGEQPFVSVQNHAGPGNMLVHSLDSGQITANVQCHRRGRQIGVFAIGACEACILRPMGATEPRRSIPEFRQDLARLTEVVADLNKDTDAPFTTMFMGGIPVDEEKAREVWHGDVFNNGRFDQYEEVLMQHLEKTGGDYVDLRTGFNPDTMLASDAVHPNELGSQLIHQRMATAIFGQLGLSVPSADTPIPKP